MFKKGWREIPNKIGVYLFKDKRGKVLYIGKAINLKERISQHLKSKNQKIKLLIQETKDLEYLVLDSEAEALLKEAELIKKFDPKYNHLLKDDTQYFYVCFTKEKYPKILITHQPQKYNCEAIGPFTEGISLRKILKLIRKEIPFCTCLYQHPRNCLNALLDLCYGWCCQKGKTGDPKLYQANIEKIKKILTGNLKELKEKLLLDLEKAIADDNLELGAKIKKEILAINKIMEHTGLIKEDGNEKLKVLKMLKNFLGLKKLPYLIEAYDISHLAGNYKVGVRVLFKNGEYDKEGLRRFKIKTVLKPDDPKMIYEVLNRRFKHQDWTLPDLILIDGGKIQYSQALKALKDNNLEKYVKIISLAKPSLLVYHSLDKPPLELKSAPKELNNFLKLIDQRAHQAVLSYHRRLREKIKWS